MFRNFPTAFSHVSFSWLFDFSNLLATSALSFHIVGSLTVQLRFTWSCGSRTLATHALLAQVTVLTARQSRGSEADCVLAVFVRRFATDNDFEGHTLDAGKQAVMLSRCRSHLIVLYEHWEGRRDDALQRMHHFLHRSVPLHDLRNFPTDHSATIAWVSQTRNHDRDSEDEEEDIQQFFANDIEMHRLSRPL